MKLQPHTLLRSLFALGLVGGLAWIAAPVRAPVTSALQATNTHPAQVVAGWAQIRPALDTPAPRPASTTQLPARRPTQTAQPPKLLFIPTPPASAEVKGMYGYGQLMALSCESRSAADWARHFGFTIHELDFFQKLPKSANPEEGFVGDVNGTWGRIPPESYGVHARPVAELLRAYGLRAKAMRGMPYAALQAEIAAGRPVLVWITGHVDPGKGKTVEIEGKLVRVAPYEHTVIITGYDAENVTVLDGKNIYTRPLVTFLDSWSALDNMAVIWSEGLGDQDVMR